MLGANVGTTLIVQLLSFNIASAAPVLFVIGADRPSGVGGSTLTKALGRIAIGLGLTLLALHILLDTLAPAETRRRCARCSADHQRSRCSASSSPRR